MKTLKTKISEYLTGLKEKVTEVEVMTTTTKTKTKPKPKAKKKSKPRRTVASVCELDFNRCQDAVRELAYLKWEEAGCPSGDGNEFWIAAEKELFGGAPSKDGYPYFVETLEGFKLTST